MYANHQMHRVMHTSIAVPAAVVVCSSNYQSGIISSHQLESIFKMSTLVDAEKINESTNVVSEIA